MSEKEKNIVVNEEPATEEFFVENTTQPLVASLCILHIRQTNFNTF